MNNRNHFSKAYEYKSIEELLNIVSSSNYQEDAKKAATWELERREIDPTKQIEEDFQQNAPQESVTFNTEKKENRLQLLLAMSTIALILRFFTRDWNANLTYGSIFDLIGIVVFVTVMIYTIKNSLKKLSTISQSFEISEESITIVNDQTTTTFNLENKPSSISRSLNELKIIEENGNEVKLNLDNYSLSYSQSKLLTKKVEELQNNWATAKTNANMA